MQGRILGKGLGEKITLHREHTDAARVLTDRDSSFDTFLFSSSLLEERGEYRRSKVNSNDLHVMHRILEHMTGVDVV